jgi:hypothetical protein
MPKPRNWNGIEPPHGMGKSRKAALNLNGGARASEKLLLERDERYARDTRTPGQIWAGDPPPGRSALDQRRKTGIWDGITLPSMDGWL